MKWSVQCQWLHKTPIYPAEQYGGTHTTKSTQVLQSVHKVMRMHGMQDTLAYSLQSLVIHSRQLLQLRTHTVLWDCFHWLNFPKLTRVHGNTTGKSWRLAYTAMQLASSNFRSWARYTVEPRYNEVLGTMKFTLLYQVSHYIRVKKQRNIKSWDQQNYLVKRGFCYIRPLYNEVPLYKLSKFVLRGY